MKQIKRISAIILAVVMLFSLASCSLVNTSETDITNDNIKIGVILSGTKDSTSGTSGICNASINQLTSLGYGIKADRFKYAENVDPSSADAVAAAYKTLINFECNIIIASDEAYASYTKIVANDNPGVLFLVYNGVSDGKNIFSYKANVTAASYLSGIVAGMKAAELKAPNIGFVLADENNLSVANAFYSGAAAVNAEAKLSAVVKSDDVAADAQKLISAGCSVIASDFSSEDIAKAATEAKIFFCSFATELPDADNYNEAYLCSPMYSFTQFFIDTIKTIVDFEMPENAAPDANSLSFIVEKGLIKDYNGSLKTGATFISAINADTAAEGTNEAVKQAQTKIINGELSFTVSIDKPLDGITIVK